jgi:hypothetical protein
MRENPLKTHRFKWALALVAAVALITVQAAAETTVSITINGPIEDMVALLQHLKDIGVGSAPGPSNGQYKVTIKSVATTTTETGQTQPPPKPLLALEDAKAEPATAKPGEAVLVTVKVSDPDHAIDTIAAAVDGAQGSIELYDNGAQGDATAADGTWTASLALPPQTTPGEHAITVSAYNAAGNPVMKSVENQAPVALTAQVKITVQP